MRITNERASLPAQKCGFSATFTGNKENRVFWENIIKSSDRFQKHIPTLTITQEKHFLWPLDVSFSSSTDS